MANSKLVKESAQVLDMMKEEIANEFGFHLGADQTARVNGAVGGEMTKRLIALAQQELVSRQ